MFMQNRNLVLGHLVISSNLTATRDQAKKNYFVTCMGGWRDEAGSLHLVRLSARGKLARFMRQNLIRGDIVGVEGELKFERGHYLIRVKTIIRSDGHAPNGRPLEVVELRKKRRMLFLVGGFVRWQLIGHAAHDSVRLTAESGEHLLRILVNRPRPGGGETHTMFPLLTRQPYRRGVAVIAGGELRCGYMPLKDTIPGRPAVMQRQMPPLRVDQTNFISGGAIIRNVLDDYVKPEPGEAGLEQTEDALRAAEDVAETLRLMTETQAQRRAENREHQQPDMLGRPDPHWQPDEQEVEEERLLAEELASDTADDDPEGEEE